MSRRVFFVVFVAALALGGAAGRCRASTICAGFLPSPCAPQDIANRSYSPSIPVMGPTGNVGVPFINDFGEREVRLTDANLACGGSTPPNYSFTAGSSAEEEGISHFVPSLFSGDGGYYIFIGNMGGADCVLAFDSKTFANVQMLDGAAGSFPHGFTHGFATDGLPTICQANTGQSGCEWSHATPTVMYAINSTTQIVKYDIANDAAGVVNVFNFNSCPNLPAFTGTYVTEMGVGGPASSPDRYFMASWGGTGQGAPTLVAYYDSQNGNCYWYDSQYTTAGGTGVATTTTGIPLLSGPPTISVAAGSSGTLANGTYYVCGTESTALGVNNATGQTQGETTCSSISSVTINNGTNNTGSIQVTFTGASNPYSLVVRGCNVYIGTSNSLSALNLQSPATNGAWPSCSGSFTQTAALSTTSQTPPAVNGAGFNIHNAQFAPDGSYVRVDYQTGSGTLVWQGETNTTTPVWCASCANGHLVNGFTHIVDNRHTGTANDPAYAIGAWNTTGSDTRIFQPPNGLSSYRSSDAHMAWTFDAPGDNVPFVSSQWNSTQGSGSGNGVQGWTTNPASVATSAFDREIVAISPSTTWNGVWRFAHTRGSYLQNPSDTAQFYNEMQAGESPDGKIAIFGTNWGWYLGNNHGSSGTCPAAGSFCRDDVFAVELK